MGDPSRPQVGPRVRRVLRSRVRTDLPIAGRGAGRLRDDDPTAAPSRVVASGAGYAAQRTGVAERRETPVRGPLRRSGQREGPRLGIIRLADLYYLAVMGLVVLTRACPGPRARVALAAAVGRLAFHLSRAKRRAIEAALENTLASSLAPAELGRTVRSVFRECWLELLHWHPSPAELRAFRNTAIGGGQHLARARAAGRGVILWESRGFGGRLAAKQILKAHGIVVHQVHGPHSLGGLATRNASATWFRRAVVRPFFDRLERRFVASVVNLPGDGSLAFARHLYGLLGRNGVLCITGDGQAGLRLREIDFLGGREPVSTGMVTLAELTGATILPMFCVREDGRARLIIEPPVRVDRTLGREGGITGGVQQYMSRLEHWIRRYPGQFRNWHLVGARAGRPVPAARGAVALGPTGAGGEAVRAGRRG
jgi:lauroyl/myristoyl acyltransferase